MTSADRTAIILVGFQNDYFAPDGILRAAVEDGLGVDRVRTGTLGLLAAVESLPMTVVSTPIHFTDDYSELVEPVGILKTIKEVGAFRRNAMGSKAIPELMAMGDRILTVPGKRGLDAFSNTYLDKVLRQRKIHRVILAGVVTSICIDSTARAAHERGFQVTILSDCTAGRTRFEQDFYCREVFPLYATVLTSHELISDLSERAPSLREPTA